jgi:hypothetical protein
VKANDKSSQGSSFSGFGASSFPGNFKSKDFEILKHYGASSPICPTRTEKGEAHQLVWPQEVVKKTYHKLGPFSR